MTKKDFFVHPSSIVHDSAQIGDGSKIWHFCHVMGGARIGANSSIGQNVFIADGVCVGNGVKVQNNVSLYAGVELEDFVFCGPSSVFTNVINPRSEIVRKSQYQKTLVKRGASIGANATIVCGVTLGRYSFIAAGAVVTKDVPDYSLVMGVPGRHTGWVSRHGHRLNVTDRDGNLVCPESNWRYKEIEPGKLQCLDWDEDRAL